MSRERREWSCGVRLARTLSLAVLVAISPWSGALAQGSDAPPEDEVAAWLRKNLGETGSTLADFWIGYPTVAKGLVAVTALAALYGLFKGAAALIKRVSKNDTKLGRMLASMRVPRLMKKGEYGEAAEILERLGRTKEAANAYFQGQMWREAADLFFRLGVKLKAARAYEKCGNYATAAVTYEELGDYEAAERCYRNQKDLRAVAKMYSKIGQHRRAAKLFNELRLTRDEAEALEKAGDHEGALNLWQELFSEYEPDVTRLTPLALRERNAVAAHVYECLEVVDVSRAREFLESVGDSDGIAEVFQKRGDFQKATELKELVAELKRSEARELSTAPANTSSVPEPAAPGVTAPEQGRARRTLGPRSSASMPPTVPREPADAVTPQDSASRAQALMDEGRFRDAGDAFEAGGDLLRAIDAYELALGVPETGFHDAPLEPWQKDLVERIEWLYERQGNPQLGAEFLQRIGCRRDAVDQFLKIGESARAAQILEELEDFEAAAQIYQDIGELSQSIHCLAMARLKDGDPVAAGDLYAEIGEQGLAADAYDRGRAIGHLDDRSWQQRIDQLNTLNAPPPPRTSPRPSRGLPPGAQASGVRRGPPPRSTRGVKPLPAALQGDVSDLHRLPGQVHGRSPTRPVPPLTRGGPPPGSPPLTSGPRRGPTRRLSGAAERVTRGGPRPPRPSGRRGPPPLRGRTTGPMQRPPALGPNTRRMASGVMRPGGPPPGPPQRPATPTGRRPAVGPGRPSPSPPTRPPAGMPPGAGRVSGATGRRPDLGPAGHGPSGRGTRRLPGAARRASETARRSGIIPPAVAPKPLPVNATPLDRAEDARQRGDLRQAAELYEAAGETRAARDCYKEMQDWKKVADLWRKEDGRFPAGILYFTLGEVQDALRELTRVPDDDPDCLPARRVVAILYAMLGQYTDAKTFFDVSFGDTVSVNDIESLYYYAQVLEQDASTRNDAMDLYGTVLELDPQFRDTQRRLDSLRAGIPNAVTSIYEDAESDRESLFYVLQESVMRR